MPERRDVEAGGAAPPRLRDLQAAFARAIDGDPSDAAALIVANGLPPSERLGIYANNVAATFRHALELTFPAVARLVGGEWFASAAKAYRQAHPSRSGDLQPAGAGYAEFLAERLAGTPHAVVADVARLEWAREEAAIAADAEPLDLSVLHDVPADRHGDLVFTLHPSVRCVSSPYPVVDVWTANAADAEPLAVDLDRGAQHALVYRRGLDVEVEALAPPAYAFTEALAAGETLAAAASPATALDPEFPLAATLTALAARGLLVAVRV